MRSNVVTFSFPLYFAAKWNLMGVVLRLVVLD
jgi:hypothetical protein